MSWENNEYEPDPAYTRALPAQPNEAALRAAVEHLSNTRQFTKLHKLNRNTQSKVASMLGFKGESFKNALQKLNRERARAEAEAQKERERERKALEELERARRAQEAASRAAEAAEAEIRRITESILEAQRKLDPEYIAEKKEKLEIEAMLKSRARRGRYNTPKKRKGSLTRRRK